MSEHRVPMLGASWRRSEDPALSSDPRVRAVVGALATLPSPAPRDEFRAELRAQLVAIAPRIIAESAEATTSMVDIVPGRAAPAAERAAGRPRHTDSAFARIRGLRLGRPLAVAASVIAAFAMLFGGAVWMSQKALPGDTLYGLKRASESWQLSTDGSPTQKARDYLKFAQTRVDEAQQLASRATASAAGVGPQAGGLDSHTAELIDSTLASADHDVISASTLLGTQAVKTKSADPLDLLTAWAPDQLTRLHDLAAAVPDSSLRGRTQSSARLVTAAVNRAKQLAPKLATGCLDPSTTDDLGPLPTCTPTSTPTKPHQQKPAHDRTKGHSGTGQPATSSQTPQQPGGPSATSPAPGSSSSPIVNLPSLLPTSTSSLPLTVDSCSVGVTLGPIGIGVGACASG
jgi:hypothetical protein